MFYIFFHSENERNIFEEPVINTVLKSLVFGFVSSIYGIYYFIKTKYFKSKEN